MLIERERERERKIGAGGSIDSMLLLQGLKERCRRSLRGQGGQDDDGSAGRRGEGRSWRDALINGKMAKGKKERSKGKGDGLVWENFGFCSGELGVGEQRQENRRRGFDTHSSSEMSSRSTAADDSEKAAPTPLNTHRKIRTKKRHQLSSTRQRGVAIFNLFCW